MGTMKSKQTQNTKSAELQNKHGSAKRMSLKSLKQQYELEPCKGFMVRFVGKVETATPGGENIDECLQDLYKKVRNSLDSLPRVCLEVSSQEIKIRWIHGSLEDEGEKVVPFSRISFVVADRKHQLFAFNDFVSRRPKKIYCYAFICSESEKSEAIANALSSAFKNVYERPRRKSSAGKEIDEKLLV